ncbi:hypothetical protein AAMO2058_001358900 [Amorphochlora amoebiformis]|mmetsp:Transcript_11727/g.18629  ORF Transcript_11727/g.18629 Transcript_11727/m.18629 type:complete len:502 (-) Transcript_11727:121-1626(-)
MESNLSQRRSKKNAIISRAVRKRRDSGRSWSGAIVLLIQAIMLIIILGSSGLLWKTVNLNADPHSNPTSAVPLPQVPPNPLATSTKSKSEAENIKKSRMGKLELIGEKEQKVTQRFGSGSSAVFEDMFPQRFSNSIHYDKAFKEAGLRQRKASAGQLTDAKYVLCAPGAQLGNRLRFVVACFALALVTERVLVVTMKSGYHASLEDIFDLQSFPLDAHKFNSAPGGGTSFGFPHSNERLTCQDPREWKETAVSFSGAYYFVPHIFYNPHLTQTILDLFPEGKVAERIQRTLLRPHKEVMKIVDAEYRRLKMDEASYLIAMQIRGNKPPAQQFWISKPEFESYDKCGTELTPKNMRGNIKHFWACDSGLAIRETKNSILGKTGKGLHRWEPEDFVKSGTVNGVRNALADILLQAKCDELLICAWSSYGQVAAAYHMAPSYMITDFDKPDGWDYADSGTVVNMCYKTETTEYSVREWGRWSKKLSCYKDHMTQKYPGKQWSIP